MAPSETEEQHAAPPAVPGPPAAERVIEMFGGIRPMAGKLNVTASTVQGWKARGHIPANREGEIREAALAHDIALDEATLAAATASQDQTAGPGMTDSQTISATPSPGPTGSGGRAGDATGNPGGPNHRGDRPPERPTERPTERPLAALALGASIAALILAIVLPIILDDEDAVGRRLDDFAERIEAVEARPAADPSGALEDLDQRVAALEADGETLAGLARDLPRLEDRLGALDERTANVVGSDEAAALAGDVQFLRSSLSDMQGRLETVSGRIGELAGRLDETEPTLTDLADTLAALRTDLGDLTARLDALDAGRAGLLLAVSQLREDVLAGRDYTGALDLVAGLGDGDQAVGEAVATLRGLDGPVPTTDMLEGRFGAAAAAAREADRAPPEDWLGEALEGVSGLVSVRPAPGENEGTDAASVLARAEGRLLDGNLTGAREALDALSAEARSAMAEWIAALERRIAAEAALSSLGERAIRYAAAE